MCFPFFAFFKFKNIRISGRSGFMWPFRQQKHRSIFQNKTTNTTATGNIATCCSKNSSSNCNTCLDNSYQVPQLEAPTTVSVLKNTSATAVVVPTCLLFLLPATPPPQPLPLLLLLLLLLPPLLLLLILLLRRLRRLLLLQLLY